MRKVLIVFVCLGLAACAGSPITIGGKTPEELQATDGLAICNAYGWQNRYGNVNSTQALKLRAELERRNVEADWDRVHRQTVWVGMNVCELMMARGSPYDIHRASYADEQWVYKSYGYYYDDYTFVYVNRSANRVTAWSN